MDDHQYFREIEEHFIRLRGAPLLLSPADWQVAKAWHEAGVPLDLVRRTLDELFAKRAEQEVTRPVQSLRYCAGAVAAAWRQAESLQEADRREAPEPLAMSPRLALLAGALPESLPAVDEARAEILALEGEPGEVEGALAKIDERIVSSLLDAMGAGERAELEGEVSRSLAAISSRMAGDELESARRRLTDQRIRRSVGLPVLSLFTNV